MISPELEVTLHQAFVNARLQRHEFISVEHLLLALLENPSAVAALNACSAKKNIEALRKSLTEFVTENTPVSAGAGEVDTQPTLGFQRVIQRSIMHVQAVKPKMEVTGANVLVAIYGEQDSHAVYNLHKQGITRIDVVNFVTQGIEKEISQMSPEDKLKNLSTETLSRTTPSATSNSKNLDEKVRVFISYSHIDADSLSRLLIHLKPFERNNLLDCWSDKKIRAGDKWRPTLEANLEQAAVAVLLISADFLASDFIVNNELPPLLVRAEAKGIRIIPVILKPCGFHRDKTLQSFQAINDPKSPLIGMTMVEQEFLYDAIAEEIHKEILQRSSG